MRAKLHLSSHPAVDKSPALWGWDFSLRVLYNLISFSVSTRALSPSSVIYIISKLFLDVLRTDIAQTWLVFFEMPPLEWIQTSWISLSCCIESNSVVLCSHLSMHSLKCALKMSTASENICIWEFPTHFGLPGERFSLWNWMRWGSSAPGHSVVMLHSPVPFLRPTIIVTMGRAWKFNLFN